MSLADTRSACSSPAGDHCAECDATASVTSDLHKYQVACTCKSPAGALAQYACALDPGAAPSPLTSQPRKEDTPPALPPRPPPRHAVRPRAPRARNASSHGVGGTGVSGNPSGRGRKYAWWCVGCGGTALALGALLAAAHAALRAYTASPHHLETVPAAVPAAMLVLTGLCILSLARRRNRYSYMIKVVGACCLVCALTCVLVTITTTVIHMNRLQTLRECVFTQLTRTCTCYSVPLENQQMGEQDDSVRCVFEGVSDCGVVHGALYWCLRAVFALSFTAVLVCILSTMLAYQLLSHERKKMYWEQLELRCRSLYRPAPQGTNQHQLHSGVPASACECCPQCHNTPTAWDISLQHRFWAPGRIGNLYSPNPGTSRRVSPWSSWFPWARNNSQRWRATDRTVEPRAEHFAVTPTRCRVAGQPSSGDSSYGFCDSEGAPNQSGAPSNPNGSSGDGRASGNTQWGPPPPYSPHGRLINRQHHHHDPAAANLLHQHQLEFHHRTLGHVHPHAPLAAVHTCGAAVLASPHRASFHVSQANINQLAATPHMGNQMIGGQALANHVLPNHLQMQNSPSASLLGTMNYNLQNQGSVRGHLVPYNCHQLHQQMPPSGHFESQAEIGPNVMQEMEHVGAGSGLAIGSDCRHHANMDNFCGDVNNMLCSEMHLEHRHLPNNCRNVQGADVADGVPIKGNENLAFQNDKHSPRRNNLHLECQRAVNMNAAESEVYFADVSSCCNMSVKAMEYCSGPNMSALVGTIENQPESTSGDSDSGSLTMRRQRLQTQQNRSRMRLPAPDTKFSPGKCIQASATLEEETAHHIRQEQDFIDHNRSGSLDQSERFRMNQGYMLNQAGESYLDHGVRLEGQTAQAQFAPNQSGHFGPTSPITPATEESLVSDDDTDNVFRTQEPHKGSPCLGPDSQYETVKETKAEEVPPKLVNNHQHCYSDTNTMDSGWQSGSEKHAID